MSLLKDRLIRALRPALLATAIAAMFAAGAQAEKISNPVAVFSGLDKITGRIISFDVYIDETVQFGALQVTPRVCYTRPLSEAPRTTTFVEIDEITLDNKVRRIFTGWMFASSPGLHAVEHAVYDIWLTGCKEKSNVPPPPGTPAAEASKSDAEDRATELTPANAEQGSDYNGPAPTDVPKPKPEPPTGRQPLEQQEFDQQPLGQQEFEQPPLGQQEFEQQPLPQLNLTD
ncbi:hypothetical protein CH339_03745 [Rhodobium orientis]|uniref:Glycosyl hydrolase family 5 n=1 Tax=Rhodobium orientis TaxID=34017 RepID=A0A327JVZ0_9HYPH|nr:hypothetical protein [Rhodobium orientis]RAI29092.1 hypothetical protein CH339_03745 [Rhodobium orientis]